MIKKLIITLFLFLAFTLNVRADFIDTMGWTPYNFNKIYTSSGASPAQTISDTFYFTWQHLYVKNVSCRLWIDLNKFSDFIYFTLLYWNVPNWSFTNTWLINQIQLWKNIWTYTQDINAFFSWSITMNMTRSYEFYSLLPIYWSGNISNRCFVNWILFDKVPNMNNNFFDNLQTYFSGDFQNNLIFILTILFVLWSMIFIYKFGFEVWINYFISKKIWQKD